MPPDFEEELASLLVKLQEVISSEKPSSQVAAIASCVFLVALAETFNPDECEVFANMLLGIEQEIRCGHDVAGGVH